MKIALLAAQKSKKVWIAAPSYLCSYHQNLVFLI